jgi:hypothetical protein
MLLEVAMFEGPIEPFPMHPQPAEFCRACVSTPFTGIPGVNFVYWLQGNTILIQCKGNRPKIEGVMPIGRRASAISGCGRPLQRSGSRHTGFRQGAPEPIIRVTLPQSLSW